MEQNLENDDSVQKIFSERVVNVKRGKSNKCNQCDYTSSQAGNLRTHLKMHSGEKTNKCNQCYFVSSRAGNLKTHLKTHSGEKSNKWPAIWAMGNDITRSLYLSVHWIAEAIYIYNILWIVFKITSYQGSSSIFLWITQIPQNTSYRRVLLFLFCSVNY